MSKKKSKYSPTDVLAAINTAKSYVANVTDKNCNDSLTRQLMGLSTDPERSDPDAVIAICKRVIKDALSVTATTQVIAASAGKGRGQSQGLNLVNELDIETALKELGEMKKRWKIQDKQQNSLKNKKDNH
ncbi:hypothetical protein [Pseudomonas sp. TE3911]